MKILIDLTGLYGRQHTGVENYSMELYDELCKKNSNVIGIFSKKIQLSNGDYTISPFNNRVINDFFVIPLVILLQRPNVVIFPIFPPIILIYLFKFIGVRVVPVIHDLAFKRYTFTLSFSAKIFLWYRYVFALRLASSLITVSEHVRRDVEQFTRVKVYNFGQSIGCINPFESNEFAQSVLERYSLSSGDFILSVSTVEPRKNLKYLLRIMIRFKQIGYSDRLLLVGRMGWNTDNELFELLEELGDSVLFAGYVSNKELSVLYRNCKYFISVSLYEGFGRTPLEAALFGSQVVVSDIPAFRENLDGLATFLPLNDIDVAIEILKNRRHYEINRARLYEVIKEKWTVDARVLL